MVSILFFKEEIMYDVLLSEISKRVNDLNKFTDDSYANHHQIRGRYMEAIDIQKWLIASAQKDLAEKQNAKNVVKGKKKVAEPKAPSNVTALPKKAKKLKAVPSVNSNG